MKYKETLQYLYNRLPVFHQLGAAAYKPGLQNTIQLMEYLDNPYLKFATIHVAGTNGKGSVSHYMAAILQESGYKVGLYTSPHLLEFGERIRVNGQMIEEQYVVDFVESHMDAIENMQPSFFELTMAMAFSYFAYNKVDIAVIEVGLGGRLDSTNIINPVVSIITNIGLDHVDFLGNSLSQIAAEKAGIIKSGVPVVIGETLPETKPVFILKSIEMDAAIYFVEDIESAKFTRFERDKMKFIYQQQAYDTELLGLYQLKNLSTVFLASKVLHDRTNFKISTKALRLGISKVCQLTGLRGRWELLQTEPRIIADTAHNVQGIQTLIEQVLIQPYNTLRIIMGLVRDKDCNGIFEMLPREAAYYYTQAQVQRALPAAELKKKTLEFSLAGESYDSITHAINAAIAESDSDDLILITGSNFVVGEALSRFK